MRCNVFPESLVKSSKANEALLAPATSFVATLRTKLKEAGSTSTAIAPSNASSVSVGAIAAVAERKGDGMARSNPAAGVEEHIRFADEESDDEERGWKR
jgi:hypothetical protein